MYLWGKKKTKNLFEKLYYRITVVPCLQFSGLAYGIWNTEDLFSNLFDLQENKLFILIKCFYPQCEEGKKKNNTENTFIRESVTYLAVFNRSCSFSRVCWYPYWKGYSLHFTQNNPKSRDQSSCGFPKWEIPLTDTRLTEGSESQWALLFDTWWQQITKGNLKKINICTWRPWGKPICSLSLFILPGKFEDISSFFKFLSSTVKLRS